jgi:uroporphyrinogen-III synthase
MVHDAQGITLLITRPLNEAQEIMRALVQRGFSIIVDPLLQIIPVDCSPLNLKNVQALVATSINGIRRLAQLTPYRHIPLYVTGEVSAHEARQAGFNSIYVAQGSVDSLIHLIREKLDFKDGKILYISGQEIRGDLVQILSSQGYPVERIIVYKALASPSLKSETQEAMITGRLSGVLFFSPRTAEIFVTLTKVYAKAFERMIAVCMSTEISKPLEAYTWKTILIPQEKSGRSMIDRLENYFQTQQGREIE